MLFLLIFPVLVSGFLACHIHPIHYYKLHRYEGQYLYLKSAELGLKCFFIALVFSLLQYYFLPNQIVQDYLTAFTTALGAETRFEAKKMAWFFTLSLLTFLSSFVLKIYGHLSLWLRFGFWNARVFIIAELLEDSPLDNLLFNLSLQKDKYAMLTMSDRKVYVGKVISLGEPTETNGIDQDILIMPLMSGYRDKDTLTVKFTTNYEEVGADIYVSLRQESIISATQFDFVAYRRWNPANGRLT